MSDFTDYYGPLANDIAQRTGLHPSVVLGIMSQETGDGQHIGGHNLFGMKGANGKMATYPDETSSGQAFANLMQTKRYAPALAEADPDKQALAIANAGYGPSTGSADAVNNPGQAAGQDYVNNIVNKARAFRAAGIGVPPQVPPLPQNPPQPSPISQANATPVPPPSVDDLMRKSDQATAGPSSAPSVSDLMTKTGTPMTEAEANPPPPPPPPATPSTIDYIAGVTKRGAASLGYNVQAANNAELDQFGAAPETAPAPSQADMNKTLFGSPTVQAPNAFARYAGAIGEAAASNPIMAAAAPVSTMWGAVGSQAGADAFPGSRIAPIIGGLVGGSVPSLAESGVNALSGASRTIPDAAKNTFDLAHQYGVDLRAPQVPGALPPSANALNSGLKFVAGSQVGNDITTSTQDQWMQALHRAIGGDGSATTLTPTVLSDAEKSARDVVDLHENSVPYNPTFSGPQVRDIVSQAPLSDVEAPIITKLQEKIASGDRDYRYGDAINDATNTAENASTPGVRMVAGAIKRTLQDNAADAMTYPPGSAALQPSNPNHLFERFNEDNIVHGAGDGNNIDGFTASPNSKQYVVQDSNPGNYTTALQNLENIRTIKNIPQKNGQITPSQLSNAVNANPPLNFSRINPDKDTSSLYDLAHIGGYVGQPGTYDQLSKTLRSFVEPAIELGGLAYSGMHPYVAGTEAAGAVAANSAQRYLNSQGLVNRLTSATPTPWANPLTNTTLSPQLPAMPTSGMFSNPNSPWVKYLPSVPTATSLPAAVGAATGNALQPNQNGPALPRGVPYSDMTPNPPPPTPQPGSRPEVPMIPQPWTPYQKPWYLRQADMTPNPPPPTPQPGSRPELPMIPGYPPLPYKPSWYLRTASNDLSPHGGYTLSNQPPENDVIDKAPPITDSEDKNTVTNPSRLRGAKGLKNLLSRDT